MDFGQDEVNRTIDAAIDDCRKKISAHRRESFLIGSIIISVMAFFGLIMYSMIIQIKLQTEYNGVEVSTVKSLQNELKYVSELMTEKNLYARAGVITSDSIKDKYNENLVRIVPYIRTTIDSLNSINGPTTNQNSKSESPLYYFFYAIFLLLFGVGISLYRFQLKEISKYEQFIFGLYRIRIAGNNYQDGFATEVRTSLTQDAFSINEGSSIFKKDKKVESPIPGHPTSDLATLVINKMLEGIDITTKPREKKPD